MEYRAKLHWVVFRGAIFFALLAPLTNSAVWLVLAVAVAIVEFLNFTGSEFGVTNKRVVIKVGVLRRRSLETLLNKIEGVSVDQGLLGRILGYGTITVNGTGSTKTPFANIAAPFEFRKAVQTQIEEAGKPPTPTAFKVG